MITSEERLGVMYSELYLSLRAQFLEGFDNSYGHILWQGGLGGVGIV